ncbi:MAG: GumC family protein [Cyclobacteriaceae bacterium]
MRLYDFFRLIYRNLGVITFVPTLMAVLVFLLTINEKKTYESSALLYTGLASGYDIESGTSERVDYREINAAYDNLISIIDSRFTLEEVGLRLLAYNLSQDQPNEKLGKAAFELIQEIFPENKRRELVFEGDIERTYEKLFELYRNGDPVINQIIRGSGSHSIEKLRTVTVKRFKSSDMVSLSYQSYDAGLCQNTLKILVDVFISRSMSLKESETGDVVGYFEQEVEKTREKLTQAENDLTNFRIKSRVINYSEETKALAIKKQNAQEQFAQLTRDFKATEAALNQLEEKLEIRKDQFRANSELIDSKNSLSSIATEIAIIENRNAQDSTLKFLYSRQDSLKASIRKQMDYIVSSSSTPEGIQGGQLVTDWLDNLVQYNRESASLKMFLEWIETIDKEYEEFTPMGSTIDRMERQINVYEREYLTVLNGLNQAKLKAKNLELTGKLEVLDAPDYPVEPESSKRMLLVLMSLFVGFVGVLSFLIAVELLDDTLKNPEKGSKDTGLELAAAFPFMDEKYMNKYADITSRLLGFFANNIKLERFVSKEKEQTLITIFSLNEGVGKSTILRLIHEVFVTSGEKSILVTPNKELAENHEHVVDYSADESFSGIDSLESLIAQEKLKEYQYVFLELPPLVDNQIPINLVGQSSISLLVARADRTWSRAHQHLLKNYQKLTAKKLMLVLNGVKLHHLDQILGELPLERSKLVNWIRKLLRFELSNSKLNTYVF